MARRIRSGANCDSKVKGITPSERMVLFTFFGDKFPKDVLRMPVPKKERGYGRREMGNISDRKVAL